MIASDQDRRLSRWLGRAAVLWLVALPTLRPLIWSGEPSDTANLFYLSLLGAAIATGLLQRALRGGVSRPDWTVVLGAAFLGVAAIGCWRSPAAATAWPIWWAWALHLGAAVALAPQVRRTPRALMAGLLAGLAIEGLLLASQVQIERPALQEELAVDPAVVEHERLRDQYHVRAHSWRLEGSFLLANTLAAYLITVLPLVVGLAWASWRQRLSGRLALSAFALLAVFALARSGSKAGMLALLCAGGVTAILAWPRPRQRVIVVCACSALLVGALAFSGVRDRLEASAGVRLDYWRAAVTLIGERPLVGHGAEGFRVHFPRVKPLDSEETVIAHSEPLQAAVDLGIPAAVLLLAWWAVLLLRLRPQVAATPGAGAAARVHLPTAAAVAALIVYVAITGTIVDANIWEPEALAWLVFGASALTVLVLYGIRLPAPPRWAALTGVLACLLHAFADFHLHSPQVVGILALVAVLPESGSRPRTTHRLVRIGSAQRTLLVGAALSVLVLALVYGATTALAQAGSERARAAESVLRRLRVASRRDLGDAYLIQAETAVSIALRAYPVPLESLQLPPDLVLAQVAVDDALAQCLRFPDDPMLAQVIVAIVEHAAVLHPQGGDGFTPTILAIANRWPDHVVLVQAASRQLRRTAGQASGDAENDARREAQRWAQRAVDLYPTQLSLRAELAAIAEANGDSATAMRERAAIERLAPHVHAVNAQ